MRASGEPVASLGDEELIDLFSRRLPELLERRPELEPTLFGAFLKTFARREEVAVVLTELRALRTEMERRFEQVDQRFEQVDRRIEQFRAEVAAQFSEVAGQFAEVAGRFDRMERSIDRLGSRWGIRNESLFRQTMGALLEQSFGVAVEQRIIEGEQFDVVIHDHQHVLVEIAASVGRSIRSRLERKRRVYEQATGVRPARVILATASIYSVRAQQLREAGIEVIEPEELDDPEE